MLCFDLCFLIRNESFTGLKSHAVTLYEAGKLADSSITELCKDLGTLEGKKFEGELQEFANHAYSLRCILECLQSGGIAGNEIVDKDGNQSDRQDGLNGVTSLTADVSIAEESRESETKKTQTFCNDEMSEGSHSEPPKAGSVPDEPDGSIGTAYESFSAAPSENSICVLNDDLPIDQSAVLSDVPTAGKGILKKKRKYRVDVLRCESLAALAPATLERLLLRDYDIIVSMNPLPSSSVLPGPTGPIHFGPPSYSSMTPWMKLVLYTLMGVGPLSIVLMKGQCLRLLPSPLKGCEKALIWSWDGSVVGGLGGKSEGSLVNGNVLLHCLNAILKYSAVLVQPLSRYDLDKSGRIITVDIPLPLKNFDGSEADIGAEMGLSQEKYANVKLLLSDLSDKSELFTVGYIRILRLFKEKESDLFLPDNEMYEWVPLSLEFGIPLFSPELCDKICKRVIASNLLQADLLTEHHDAMQSLRKKLRDICSEYQATGPTAKLFYQRGQGKETPRNLINYASGRWSPLLDPSTPVSAGSGEHHRLKLASRQRCRTEVLSFDGNILRYSSAGYYDQYKFGSSNFESAVLHTLHTIVILSFVNHHMKMSVLLFYFFWFVTCCPFAMARGGDRGVFGCAGGLVGSTLECIC